MKIVTETLDGHTIRYVESESGDLRMVAEDAAIACGYTPIHLALGADEWIIDKVNFGDAALALTNDGNALYITDFYGDAKQVLVPNVCRKLETVCENENHRIVFREILLSRELIDPNGWADQSPVIAHLYDLLGISPGELREEHEKRASDVIH